MQCNVIGILSLNILIRISLNLFLRSHLKDLSPNYFTTAELMKKLLHVFLRIFMAPLKGLGLHRFGSHLQTNTRLKKKILESDRILMKTVEVVI